MQNSAFWTRISSLYGSQPSSVVFECQTASFGSELQVSKSPRQNLSFCAWKTATLAHELLVSMGPSPHLWCLLAKQQLLDPNNKSLLVPVSPVVLCMQYSVISTRNTCLYGSQPLSVVFAFKTATFVLE